MTAVIDYGVGNLFSLTSSLRHIGAENVVTGDAAVLEAAQRIILPGVGAFGDAMEKLEATGLVPVLRRRAARGVPLLGICLGMQLLFETSYEALVTKISRLGLSTRAWAFCPAGCARWRRIWPRRA